MKGYSSQVPIQCVIVPLDIAVKNPSNINRRPNKRMSVGIGFPLENNCFSFAKVQSHFKLDYSEFIFSAALRYVMPLTHIFNSVLMMMI